MNSVQQNEADESSKGVTPVLAAVSEVSTTDSCSEDNHLINVASSSNGARVLFATDEWFATCDNMISDCSPVFDPDAYCEQGKVMDGWETRRRRLAGHDWCIIQLSSTSSDCAVACDALTRVDIDTAYFTGNQVPAISLEVASLTLEQEATLVRQLPGAVERLLCNGKGIQGMGASPTQAEQAVEACNDYEWTEILPRTPLQPGYEETRFHSFALNETLSARPATHLKVNYFPDGGVARLRLWGKKSTSSSSSSSDERMKPTIPPPYMPITTGSRCTVIAHSSCPEQDMLPSRRQRSFEHAELSSAKHGGQGVACSNHHYGEPQNLIQANLGRDMGDGWETARHPDRPGILVRNPVTHLIDNDLSDWCILKLGQVAQGGVSRVILDTKHFRGNYPESVKVEGALVINAEDDLDSAEWFPLVERCKMAPDAEHVFDATKEQLSSNAQRPVSHVRVSIYPDGGLSRVRVYGRKSKKSNRREEFPTYSHL